MVGSINGASVSLTLTPSVPTNCPYTVTATVSGNAINGTYATFNCLAALSGSVTLTKQ
jgi:hypothetical protein